MKFIFPLLLLLVGFCISSTGQAPYKNDGSVNKNKEKVELIGQSSRYRSVPLSLFTDNVNRSLEAQIGKEELVRMKRFCDEVNYIKCFSEKLNDDITKKVEIWKTAVFNNLILYRIARFYSPLYDEELSVIKISAVENKDYEDFCDVEIDMYFILNSDQVKSVQ